MGIRAIFTSKQLTTNPKGQFILHHRHLSNIIPTGHSGHVTDIGNIQLPSSPLPVSQGELVEDALALLNQLSGHIISSFEPQRGDEDKATFRSRRRVVPDTLEHFTDQQMQDLAHGAVRRALNEGLYSFVSKSQPMTLRPNPEQDEEDVDQWLITKAGTMKFASHHITSGLAENIAQRKDDPWQGIIYTLYDDLESCFWILLYTTLTIINNYDKSLLSLDEQGFLELVPSTNLSDALMAKNMIMGAFHCQPDNPSFPTFSVCQRFLPLWEWGEAIAYANHEGAHFDRVMSGRSLSEGGEETKVGLEKARSSAMEDMSKRLSMLYAAFLFPAWHKYDSHRNDDPSWQEIVDELRGRQSSTG
ncbi:hypothetical protein AX17_006495 [Amanita inopinata Kibby_2008]|nr:hypothetical protein AX17_006495 [Amanita inopinata Kibby_2008]